MTDKINPLQPGLPYGIGRPATRALALVGVTELEQLTEWKVVDLLKLHGLGPKAIKVLTEALAEKDLSFATTEPKPASSEPR